jgi:rubrerythrin
MSQLNHNYVGDKSQFDNDGMYERLFIAYKCNECGYIEDLPVIFEPSINQFVLIDGQDAVCPACHDYYMDRA